MEAHNIDHQIERVRQLIAHSDRDDTQISVPKSDLETLLSHFIVLHTICESIPDGVFVKDKNGRIIMSNASGPEYIGKTVEDVMGKDAMAIFSPETARKIKTEDRQVMGSGEANTYETVETIHGEARTFQTSKIPYRDTQGQVTGVIGITRDITERKKMEEELQRSFIETKRAEAQFRELVEAAPDAIVGIDKDGRIVMVNEQTEQVFGYFREELLGRPVELLMPDQFHKKHAAHRVDYIAKPRKRLMGEGLDLLGRRKDGNEFPVEISLSPVKTDEGSIVVSIIRDVTDHKQLENQLRQHTIELEEQVLQSERLAAVGRMAAQVAHEIRNPLSSIGLNIEMLADEIQDHQWDKSDEAQSLINIVLSEIERLNNVIHDYLQFARMPTEQFQIMSINSVVNELTQFIQPETNQAHVAVNCNLDNHLPTTNIDPTRMRQAILNCVRNALEAMPNGGTLKITTRRFDAKQIALEIEDNGPGISTDHLTKVFDPFYSTKDKGTGLGLPYVRQIVKEHEGEIILDSAHESGTIIRILLPQCKTEDGGGN